MLSFQQALPLNPDGKGPLWALGYKDAGGVDHPGADTAVIFNTVCSFVTNTNLQHYSGEQHLSYLSQLAGIIWLQFVTPAAGLAVMLATVRGLRGDAHLGDFYQDLMRGIALLLIPLSLVYALTLVGTGVPLTILKAAEATTLDGDATGREDPGDRPRPGGGPGGGQADRDQRWRLLRAEFLPSRSRTRPS